MGYDCTEDCEGHEAGYNWAEKNDVSDSSDCDGKSISFNEGCTAYVDEEETTSIIENQSDNGEIETED